MKFHRGAFVLVAALAVGTLYPTQARAQHVGVWVGVGYHHGPWYAPYPYFYSPYTYSPLYSAWGQWYPYPYPYPYPPPYYGRRGDTAEARLEISPRNAQVFLDGYYMGVVNDFDGTFQRLELPAGDHEIVVYLKGYRTYRQRTFFRPGQGYHFKAILEPLAEGESQEPPPQPPAEVPGQQPPNEPGYGPPPRPGSQTVPPGERGRRGEAAGFGTLSIRVQPADAVITIDGERWDSPEGGSRLIVQLAAGPHRIEVEKEGYTPYSSTIDIHPDENQSLNVSLPGKERH